MWGCQIKPGWWGTLLIQYYSFNPTHIMPQIDPGWWGTLGTFFLAMTNGLVRGYAKTKEAYTQTHFAPNVRRHVIIPY